MTRTQLFLVLAILAGGVVPAESAAQVMVVGGLVQEHEARPGETVHGSIRLKNTTAESQEARVYQTDYRFEANGSSYYDDPGSLPRSNAGWLSFSPAYLTIPPGAEAVVEYEVAVPAAADRPLTGTYWSVIMVEGIRAGSAESSRFDPESDEPRIGLATTIRYAVQNVTHIAGTGERRLEFSGARIVAEAGGSPVLQFDVVNTGERAFRPVISVELYDGRGRSVGKFDQSRGLLYPGTSLRQRFDLSGVPSGTYQALIVADAGGSGVFGAQFDLTF